MKRYGNVFLSVGLFLHHPVFTACGRSNLKWNEKEMKSKVGNTYETHFKIYKKV